ncbi:MAG: hypothetical protein LC101_03035 [Flavobacteriales bacterium]|nr:hypothetical protein [Flavobacteriales bacterium]MCZ2442739.1 hypothetical protein [Flavobacteriales bacterium]
MSDRNPNARKYFLLGILISNLYYLILFALLYIPLSQVDTQSPDMSLVILGDILLTTSMSAIAGYYWYRAGLTERFMHGMAPVNAIITLLPFIVHSDLRVPFFIVFALLICLICSGLGVWFGRRFFA